MIPYRPKTLFQQNKDEREKWQQIAGNPTTHRAIAFAQAELAMIGYGPEQMKGVAGFIVLLLNLSEDDPVNKPFPVKKLTSFDEPPPTTGQPPQQN